MSAGSEFQTEDLTKRCAQHWLSTDIHAPALSAEAKAWCQYEHCKAIVWAVSTQTTHYLCIDVYTPAPALTWLIEHEMRTRHTDKLTTTRHMRACACCTCALTPAGCQLSSRSVTPSRYPLPVISSGYCIVIGAQTAVYYCNAYHLTPYPAHSEDDAGCIAYTKKGLPHVRHRRMSYNSDSGQPPQLAWLPRSDRANPQQGTIHACPLMKHPCNKPASATHSHMHYSCTMASSLLQLDIG